MINLKQNNLNFGVTNYLKSRAERQAADAAHRLGHAPGAGRHDRHAAPARDHGARLRSGSVHQSTARCAGLHAQPGPAGGTPRYVSVLARRWHTRGNIPGMNVFELRDRLVGMSRLVEQAKPLMPGVLKAFQEKLDFEFLVFCVFDADGDVLEVDEQRDFAFTHSPAR